MIRRAAQPGGAWRIERYGDSALELRCADEISEAASARVHAALAALREAAVPGVDELVPGYVGLTVLLHDLPRGAREVAAAAVAAVLSRVDAGAVPAVARTVVVPVCYGGECGPDLEAVAAHAGLSPDEVVARHAAGGYRVAFIGFLPGFPYLMGLEPALHMPRRATPRTRVPAGSVAIGGAQTGVYPVDSPGGWHLVGRTNAQLFDPAADAPGLLRAGDRVRFRAVAAGALVRAAIEVLDA